MSYPLNFALEIKLRLFTWLLNGSCAFSSKEGLGNGAGFLI